MYSIIIIILCDLSHMGSFMWERVYCLCVLCYIIILCQFLAFSDCYCSGLSAMCSVIIAHIWSLCLLVVWFFVLVWLCVTTVVPVWLCVTTVYVPLYVASCHFMNVYQTKLTCNECQFKCSYSHLLLMVSAIYGVDVTMIAPTSYVSSLKWTT